MRLLVVEFQCSVVGVVCFFVESLLCILKQTCIVLDTNVLLHFEMWCIRYRNGQFKPVVLLQFINYYNIIILLYYYIIILLYYYIIIYNLYISAIKCLINDKINNNNNNSSSKINNIERVTIVVTFVITFVVVTSIVLPTPGLGNARHCRAEPRGFLHSRWPDIQLCQRSVVFLFPPFVRNSPGVDALPSIFPHSHGDDALRDAPPTDDRGQ